MKIKIGKGYSAGKVLPQGTIEVENGRFRSLSAQGEADLDLSSYTVFPGLIDMHTHGGVGLESLKTSFEELDTLSKFYAESGAAAFLATTVTDSIDNLVAAEKIIAKRIKEGTSGAEIAGIYLEGPYLSHEFRGAHEEAFLTTPNKEDIDKLIAAGEGNLKVIAVAPEIDGALDAIKYITGKGVKVAIGHSGAKADVCDAGFSAGATIAIHTYNAMRGFSHREPGFLGASLVRDDAYGELICDFIHVAPKACEIALRCKGKDKIIYITDSIISAGLPDGEYFSGALPITLRDGIARTHGGALAGSSLRINRALGNVVTKLNVPVCDAMLGVTKNPAEALGVYGDIGSIDVGKRAHLTVLDDNFNVVMTIVGGNVVYKL